MSPDELAAIEARQAAMSAWLGGPDEAYWCRVGRGTLLAEVRTLTKRLADASRALAKAIARNIKLRADLAERDAAIRLALAELDRWQPLLSGTIPTGVVRSALRGHSGMTVYAYGLNDVCVLCGGVIGPGCEMTSLNNPAGWKHSPSCPEVGQPEPKSEQCQFQPPRGGGYVCVRCGREWLDHPNRVQIQPHSHDWIGDGNELYCRSCGAGQ